MSATTSQNVEIHSGDSHTIAVMITDNGTSGGTAVDLTGASLKWVVDLWPGYGSPVTEKTTTGGGISITDAVNGDLEISLVPSDTESLAGRYYHELEITDSNGNVSTALQGVLTIYGDSAT